MDEATDFAAFLGIATKAGDGAVMIPGTTALGRPGVLHGGAIATLLEQAGRAVVAAAVDRPGGGTPAIQLASMTVDYLRVGPMAEVRAAGTIVKLGARVAVVGTTAWADDPGKPFAAAKLTFLLIR